jgi:hypothetical protein
MWQHDWVENTWTEARSEAYTNMFPDNFVPELTDQIRENQVLHLHKLQCTVGGKRYALCYKLEGRGFD